MTFSNKVKNNKLTLVEYVNGKRRKKYKYVCLKCENYGTTTTKHDINKFGEIYFNGQLLKESEEYFKCPKCKNEYITKKEHPRYFKTYIEDREDKFVINIYGNSYKLFAPYKLYKMVEDGEALTEGDTTFDELKGNVSVCFDDLMDYVCGKHSVPITIAPKTERVTITIDKKTKRVLFSSNGRFVVLNRGFLPYYAEDVWASLLKVLPLEIKVMLKNIFIKDIHENDLIRWQIDKEERFDEIEISQLMYLSYVPNLFIFEPGFTLGYFNPDPYTLKKFKAAKKQIDIFKTFIPCITKRSIKHLKNVTNHGMINPRYRDVPSFYLGLFENQNTVLNILKLYEENSVRVSIETTIYVHPKSISFRTAQKMLNKFLVKGVLDDSFNYLAAGKFNKSKSERISQVFRLIDLTEDTIIGICRFGELVKVFEETKTSLNDEDRAVKERSLEDFSRKIGKYHSIKKLHDDISKINIQLSKHHYVYKYKEEQLQYECTINDFKFVLPKNTKDLINLATELDICVASYEESILDYYYYCTILGVYKSDKALLCLEIDRDNCIRQVKKYRNQVLIHGKNSEEDRLIEAMYEFLVSKNIKIDTIDLEYCNIGLLM